MKVRPTLAYILALIFTLVLSELAITRPTGTLRTWTDINRV